jgi:hypothetical protein
MVEATSATKDRVAGGHERLALVGEHRVHGVAGLVGEGEDGVERIVVVEQQVRSDAVHAGTVGAAAFALVFVDVDPPAGDELPVLGHVVLAERGDRGDEEVADGGVRVGALRFVDRDEAVVEVVVLEAEQLLAQLEVALERSGAGADGVDQRLHHGGRNGVAVERGVERGRVVPGLGGEPAALQNAVVDGGVGIGLGGVGGEMGGEGGGAVGLLVGRWRGSAGRAPGRP